MILLVLVSSEHVFAASIDYDDGWSVNEGTDNDAVTWGGESLDVGLNSLTSNADAVCWDWDNDGEYSHCYFETGVSKYECDDDFDIVSEPSGSSVDPSDLYDSHCTLGDEQCDHNIDTGSSGQSWGQYVDAIYYEDCDGSATSTDINSRKYWVVYGHQYDCDGESPANLDPDYEAKYDSYWINIDENTGNCAATEECDENHDAVISYSKTGTPDDPCRTTNGNSCSVNDDCLSDHCVNSVCRPTDPYCGDIVCDTGETYSTCPQDCCRSDCGEAIYEMGTGSCRSACDGYASCNFYNFATETACNGNDVSSNQCVDSDTYVSCCEGTPVDCSGNEYCSIGSCSSCSTVCDSSCQSSACYGTDPDCDENGDPTVQCADEADLAILEVIPIQVIPNVDMVKGKSGYVRVTVHNYGPKNATGQVNVTFDGSVLPPYNPSNASLYILNGTNATFDFRFKPDTAGSSKIISANVTILN